MKLVRLCSLAVVFLFCLGVIRAVSIAGEQVVTPSATTEAPAGFDTLTNGQTNQAEYVEIMDRFRQQKEVSDGLGPVYNALSCADCHQNPVIGGNSQVFELRAGHFNGLTFIEHPGGSLIQERAIRPSIQEQILGGNEVRTLRGSTSLLGLGFVEAISDNTLIQIANSQPFLSAGFIHGQAIDVVINEDSAARTRVGRFGWKDQQASLLSFAAEAYNDNVGITTPLSPTENSSNGSSVAAFDKVPAANPSAPDEDTADLEAFALFMRSTKVPSRAAALAATPASQAGEYLFTQVGCGICHVSSIRTAPAGTFLNDNRFGTTPETQVNVASAALGDKIIHPFSDFLLHDIGTGDGIVQGGGPSTRNKIRTVPLWGLRTRSRFMHDGRSLTTDEAIVRHAGEATQVTQSYLLFSATQRNHLLTFLRSL